MSMPRIRAVLAATALVLATAGAARAESTFYCYTSHNCEQKKMDPTTEDSTASESGLNMVDVGSYGIIRITPPDRKRGSQLVFKNAKVDFTNQCIPDGKTKEIPVKPDTNDGNSPADEMCGHVWKKAVHITVTVIYINTANEQKTLGPLSKDVTNDPKPTSTGCNGLTPRPSCHANP